MHGASQSANDPSGTSSQQSGYWDRIANLLTGTGDNAVDVNTQATATLQQQYDTAYSACMYAKGDNIPPYYMQPTYYAEPSEPTTHIRHARRRVAHRPSQAPWRPAPARLPARPLSFRRQFRRPPPARVSSNPRRCNPRVRTAASRCQRRRRIERLRLCIPGSSGARNMNGAGASGLTAPCPGYLDSV